MQGSWDDMRMEARKIEREVDAKLATLLDSTSPEKSIIEIESALRKLSEIHESMSKYLSQSGVNNAGLLLTLQRHRELLSSYRNDVKAAKSALTTAKQREELLGSSHSDVEGTRSELLMRERSSIHSSERAAETVLGYIAGQISFREMLTWCLQASSSSTGCFTESATDAYRSCVASVPAWTYVYHPLVLIACLCQCLPSFFFSLLFALSWAFNTVSLGLFAHR